MLVGEAPGRQEDERGEPFVGPAGRFLDELLASAGLQRQEVYITNVVKSRPYIGPAPGRNRPPARSEIAACRSWLDEQIRIIRPEIIVALGGVALEYFAPVLKISQVHGRPLAREGRTVLPVFHPALAVRWRELRETLRRDFLVLQALAEPDRAPRPPGQRSRLGGRAGGGQEGSRGSQKRSG